jgi:predicted secreted protein
MSRIQRIAAATFATTVAITGVVVGSVATGAAASVPTASVTTVASPVAIDRGLVIEVPRNAPPTLVLDRVLRPGMVFSVALYENASTGYVWNAKLALSPQETVKFVDSTYVPETTKPIPGSGGTRYFRYQVGDDQGAAGVTFQYQRSWEPNPIQQVTLRLLVL